MCWGKYEGGYFHVAWQILLEKQYINAQEEPSLVKEYQWQMYMSGILGFLKCLLEHKAHFKKLNIKAAEQSGCGRGHKLHSDLSLHVTLDKSSITHAAQTSKQPQPQVCSASRVENIWTWGDGAIWDDLHGKRYVIGNRKVNRFILCEIEAVRIITKWNWSTVLTFYYLTTTGLINKLWHHT